MRLNTLLFSVSTGLLFTLNAYGNSWLLTQTATTNSETTLSQADSNQAKQSVNSINLGSNTAIMNANQNFSSSGNDVNLLQDTASFSHQAVNYIAAANITEARQTVNNVDHVLLAQKNITNNSVQALNMAVTTGTGTQIDKLTQTITANSVTFSGAGANNIQAGNYIKADSISSTAGDVVQNFNVTGNVIYNLSGTNNLQAGNVLIKNSNFSANGNVSQNFSAGNVDALFSEADANGSVKAANYFAEKL